MNEDLQAKVDALNNSLNLKMSEFEKPGKFDINIYSLFINRKQDIDAFQSSCENQVIHPLDEEIS